MSWLSGFSATGRLKRRARSRVSAFVMIAERKPQELDLRVRRREQEVALVALGLAGAEEGAAARGQRARGHVVAGREQLRAEVLRGPEEIAELDRLVAVDAGDRRLAGDIALGETIDHLLLEAALVIEDVVGDADCARDHAGVVNVLARATGALAMGGGAVIVKLKRHSDRRRTLRP